MGYYLIRQGILISKARVGKGTENKLGISLFKFVVWRNGRGLQLITGYIQVS